MTKDQTTFGGGRYSIVELIGRGGVGAVYRATQNPLGRTVALKILRPRFSRNAVARRRFTREARSVAALNHPSIATVFDFGAEKDGTLFLAMEYIEGVSLATAMQRGLTPRHLIAIVDQILAALAYAHARGVVHRDLKPDNILVAYSPGTDRIPEVDEIEHMPQLIKLVDFGIATVWNAEPPQSEAETNQGEVVGTPLYMSPEQARGERTLTPAVDIYTLGVVLFEGLTGQHPFAGLEPGETPMDIMIRHVTMAMPELKPPPGVYVPEALRAIVRRCVQKQAANRYDSAASLREALREAAQLLDAHADLQAHDADDDDRQLADSSSWEPAQSEQAVVVKPYESTEAMNTVPSDATARMAASQEITREARSPLGEAKDDGLDEALRSGYNHGAPNWSALHARMRLHRFGIRTEVPLVGRTSERAQLKVAVRNAVTHGVGQVILLEGETGIGKTKLATWLQERIAEYGKMRCLSGRFIRDAGSGLRGVRDVFEELFGVRGMGRDAALTRVTERLRSWGADDVRDAHALLTFLQPSDMEPHSEGGAIGGTPQEVLFALLVRTLERASRARPLSILLDDIHWAGAELADLLEFFAVEFRYRPCHLLIVCTVRSDDLPGNPKLAERLRQLSRYDGETLSRLPLSRLPPEVTEALVGKVLPASDELLEHVVQRSQGNPLHIVQLLSYLYQEDLIVWDENRALYDLRTDSPELIAAVPPSLADLLLMRFDQLEARHEAGGKLRLLLDRCAVLGSVFAFDVLAQLVDLEGNAELAAFVEAGVDALLQESMLQHVRGQGEDLIGFNHAMIREVLLTQMQGRQLLRRLHELAAEAKETHYRNALERHARMIANHWIRAGESGRALDLILMAANTARAGYHLRDAVRLYTQAVELACQVTPIELPRLLRLLHLIGELREGFGQFVEAQLRYAQILRLALGHLHGTVQPLLVLRDVEPPVAESLASLLDSVAAASHPGELGEDKVQEVIVALLGLGRTLRHTGYAELAQDYFQQALYVATNHKLNTWVGAAKILLGEAAWDRGEYNLAEDLGNEVLDDAVATGDVYNRADALHLLAEVARLRGDPARTASMITQAREAYEVLGDRRHVALCLRDLAQLARARNDLENAARLFSEARQRFEELGDRHAVASCFNGLGEVARFSERLHVAESCYQRAYDTFLGLGAPVDAAISLVNLGLTALSAGRLSKAEEALLKAQNLARGQNHPYLGVGLHLNLALLRAHQERWDEVSPHLEVALSASDRHGVADPDYARPLEQLAALTRDHGWAELSAELDQRADKMWSQLGTPRS